jgi:hypothetical protein
VLGYFLIVLGLTGRNNHVSDWLTCAGCIALFSGFIMVVENTIPVESVCFMMTAFIWGLFLQPSIFNHCHLTLWLLIFQAFRNLFIVESHATAGWGFATMADAYRLVK